MEKRNQHYIPQFYLNYFTDPLTPPVQTPYVWILDKKKETIKNRAPRNFAFKKGFYDIIDLDGHSSSIVEDQFKHIEDKASNVFRKIKRLEYISKTDRLILSKFLFSLRARVPKFHNIYKKMVDGEYYKEFLNGKLKNEIFPSELPIDSVIRATNVGSYFLIRMKWSLLIAPEESYFITSDNPVIVKNVDYPNSIFCGVFSSLNAQVIFPLSSKICLFGEWVRVRRVVENIDENEVDEINFEIYKYSDEFVYSSSKFFMEEILLLNKFINKGLIK